jgi:transcription elongation factor Elf1
MPSTFKCPFCRSRYNKWVASSCKSETKTEVSTYHCKQCLSLFERRIFYGEKERDGEGLVILEM